MKKCVIIYNKKSGKVKPSTLINSFYNIVEDYGYKLEVITTNRKGHATTIMEELPNDIDLVISSDLKRAMDSADFLFKEFKEILHDERIRECNYGDFNGKEKSLVKYEEHIDIVFPNGESLKDVEIRISKFCEYLLEKYDGKTIALVAHKAPQLALDVITKKISWEDAINKDWRKIGNWQPGWWYEIK